jgi:hypothetical protein
MDERTSEMTFRRGDATSDRLQEVVDEVLGELAVPGSEAAQSAEAAGVRADDVADAQARILEGQQGLEPILTTIVVTIAVKAGSDVAETLWTEVIWPRLRRRLGVRALGEATSKQPDARA